MTTLPKGWSTADLRTLAGRDGLVTDGDWIESKDQDPTGDVRLIQLMDIGDGNFRNRSQRYLTSETANMLGCTFLEAGDVLIARMPDPLGRACIFPGVGQPAVTAVDVLVWRGGKLSIFPEWLTQAVNSPDMRSQILAEASGTTRQRISGGRLKSLTIPVPPLSEQKRIVAKVESLTAKSARARVELQKIDRLVARYKELVLVKALSGELTADWRKEHPEAVWSEIAKNRLTKQMHDFLSNRRGARVDTHAISMAALRELPRTWLMGLLASIGSLQVGYAFKSTWYSHEGERLLRGANVAPGFIDWSDEKRLAPEHVDAFSTYKLTEGDIVIAMDRPLISAGLKIAIVGPEDAGCLLVQRVGRFQANEMFHQKYVWWVLNSKLFLDHCSERSTGSDLPHISGNDIQSTPTPLPPIEEQHEIVRRIETAFAKIDRLAAEAKRALELTDRLDEKILAKAFRGELVPQDPNDEPASVLLERIRAERAAAPKAKRGRKAASP